MPVFYMRVTAPGVEGCQVCRGFNACYCTGCRRVPSVPGFYTRVTAPGVEGCQLCLGFTCVLLHRV